MEGGLAAVLERPAAFAARLLHPHTLPSFFAELHGRAGVHGVALADGGRATDGTSASAPRAARRCSESAQDLPSAWMRASNRSG